MRPKSLLFLPPSELSSCIAAAIFRDTRHVVLEDRDRFNYFPASPLVSATIVLTGELRPVENVDVPESAFWADPYPQSFVTPPVSAPTISWSPGPVAALTIGFYPDSWAKLGYNSGSTGLPDALAKSLKAFDTEDDPSTCWENLCTNFAPSWQEIRTTGGLPDWVGSDRLSDWSRYLLARVALAGPGRGIRSLERRLKRWTGHNRQALEHYATLENLHRHVVNNPSASLADISTDAGYTDQSHMGRAVRRATGFSPARLNRRIEEEEAFWCYRLLGDRF